MSGFFRRGKFLENLEEVVLLGYWILSQPLDLEEHQVSPRHRWRSKTIYSPQFVEVHLVWTITDSRSLCGRTKQCDSYGSIDPREVDCWICKSAWLVHPDLLKELKPKV